MNIAVLMSIFVGLCAVMQGGLNRKISESWGLMATTVFNAWVFLAGSLVFYYWAKFSPESFEAFWRPNLKLSETKWWYILPGLFGIGIVMGLPFSISKIGAAKTMIWMIVAQVVFSLLWDVFVEKYPVSTNKVIGIALMIVGTFFVNK